MSLFDQVAATARPENFDFLSGPSEQDGNVREDEQPSKTDIFNETVAMLERIGKTLEGQKP